MIRMAFLTVMIGLLSGPAGAAGLTGIWATEPDAKAQTGHVQITPCGAALCGTVVRAYDSSGRQIVTANVGKLILTNVTGQDPSYSGRVFVPIMNSQFPVEIENKGSHLTLRACNSVGICRRQVWRRVN